MTKTIFPCKPLLLFLALLLLQVTTRSQTIYEKLFWPNFGISNTITSINLDGTDETINVPSSVSGEPITVEVDPIGQKIYWYDQVSDNIKRANLDGSSAEDIVTGAGAPLSLCVDLNTASLYWADFVAVRAINLDGTNRRTIVSGAGVGEPTSVQVDGLAGDVFWADQA